MKRVLFKISGELLSKGGGPLSMEGLYHVIEALAFYKKEGLEIGVVIGGGNLFRGRTLDTNLFRRSAADRIGMTATLINGLALEEAGRTIGCPVRLLNAFACPKLAEEATPQRVDEALSDGEIIIFSGGTGNPFFSTDSAAALRAAEMGADLLVKVTQVDGIYDRDPKEAGAVKLKRLTHKEYLDRGLQVMDFSAVSICRDQKIPIYLFHRDHFGMKPLKQIIEENLGSKIENSPK